MTILLTTSNIRIDEKLIIAALDASARPYVVVDVRQKLFDRRAEPAAKDAIVLNRCVSQAQSLASTWFFESLGIPCVNSSTTIALCGDKLATTLKLQAAGLPVPKTVFALARQSALRAVETVGLPAVIKPAVGSWGRMVVRANDIDGAEAIIELRENLPGPQHRLHYVQEWVDTANRDIRAIAIDGEILTAYRRRSDHWVTNAARGATGEPCTITDELRQLCRKASDAVGGGILSFDLFEVEDGYLLNEINHTTEFALATRVTGVDIAGAFVDFVRERSDAWYR